MLKNKLYNLLRWSEKYTKTDMVYLAQGGFWLIFSQTVGVIVAFLITIIFANLLSKTTYGSYQYIASIIAILTIFNLPGLNTALTQAIAKNQEGSVYDIIKTKIKWSLIASLIFIFIAGYYQYKDNTDFAKIFLLCALFFPILESFDVYASILNAKKLFKTSSIYKMIRVTTYLLFITLIITKFHSLTSIITAHLAINTTLSILFFILAVKKYKANKEKDPETIKYGKHLSFMGILGAISMNIDKLILWHFLGPVQLAVYALSISPIIHIKGYLQNLGTLALPKISQQNHLEIQKNLPQKISRLYFVLFFIIIIYWLAAPTIYKIFFPAYLESVFYSQLYSLILLFYPQNLLLLAIQTQYKTKFLYIINTISPILQIVLMLILVPLFQIKGAIGATILQLILNGFLLRYYFKKI